MSSIDFLMNGNLEFSNTCNRSGMKKLAMQQNPKILWIGCSDSRVCPETISNMGLGNIFVHRNIANQVSNTDKNFLSVLEYAVNFLAVDTIVVCGHSACGGVKAALEGLPPTEHIADWIEDLEKLALSTKQLNLALSAEELEQKLIETNVIHQIDRLKEISIIKDAWGKKQSLCLYGVVFDIAAGKLKLITTIGSDNEK